MDWSTQSFDTINQTLKTDISQQEICNPQHVKKVITFASPKTYFEAKDYCKTFGTLVGRSRAFDKFIILLPEDCDLQIRDERILKGNFTLNL